MSRIHYFQRYSSPENTVTNNTLQLFGRIYEYSARAASSLISELTGEAIYIGIEITQQNKSSASVPDGLIIQNSFKIVIEAKVDAPVDFDQLKRHASSFGTEALRILLLLTKAPLTSNEKAEFVKLKGEFPGLVMRSITYEDICNATRQLFKPHEETIIGLVDDYIEYCNDTALFDQSRELMRIVPCGQSVDINLMHRIYFQPSDRGYTNHAFVGIYSQKAVRAILEIKSVFDVELEEGNLEKQRVEGENTSTYDDSIRAIIADAKTNCDYDIESGHRFFCGKMVSTNYQKISPGGIQGARFVNLREVLGPHGDVEDIASKLSKVTWE
jgi:hypothetical protein